jgi:hypothetical protein
MQHFLGQRSIAQRFERSSRLRADVGLATVREVARQVVQSRGAADIMEAAKRSDMAALRDILNQAVDEVHNVYVAYLSSLVTGPTTNQTEGMGQMTAHSVERMPFTTLEFDSRLDAENMISHLWRDESLKDVDYDIGAGDSLVVRLSPDIEKRLRETGIRFRIRDR